MVLNYAERDYTGRNKGLMMYVSGDIHRITHCCEEKIRNGPGALKLTCKRDYDNTNLFIGLF